MSTKNKENGIVGEPVAVGYGMQTARHDIDSSPVHSQKHISLTKLERESMTVNESEQKLTDIIHKQYCKL